MPDQGPGNNAKISAVSSILTSATTDSWVKFGTIALVAMTGIGNWFATKTTAESNYAQMQADREETRKDILRAVQETHEIHDALSETLQRQKDMYVMLQKLAAKEEVK